MQQPRVIAPQLEKPTCKNVDTNGLYELRPDRTGGSLSHVTPARVMAFTPVSIWQDGGASEHLQATQ